MKTNGTVFISLNCMEDNMIRLGDGIRLALVAYNSLKEGPLELDEDILEDTLYELLTDLPTYTGKKSFEHFSTYVVEYLIDKYSIEVNRSKFRKGCISCYTTPEEYLIRDTLLSYPLFEYLYSSFLEEIVKFAIINFNEDEEETSTNYIGIPFNEYSKFYTHLKTNDKDKIATNFLSDLESFLAYNHIIQLKDFEIDDITNDLSLPIKFNFSTIKRI